MCLCLDAATTIVVVSTENLQSFGLNSLFHKCSTQIVFINVHLPDILCSSTLQYFLIVTSFC